MWVFDASVASRYSELWGLRTLRMHSHDWPDDIAAWLDDIAGCDVRRIDPFQAH